MQKPKNSSRKSSKVPIGDADDSGPPRSQRMVRSRANTTHGVKGNVTTGGKGRPGTQRRDTAVTGKGIKRTVSRGVESTGPGAKKVRTKGNSAMDTEADAGERGSEVPESPVRRNLNRDFDDEEENRDESPRVESDRGSPATEEVVRTETPRNIPQYTQPESVAEAVALQNLEKQVVDSRVAMLAQMRMMFDNMKGVIQERDDQITKLREEVTNRLEKLETRLTRIEHSVNIQLFAAASKAKSAKEQERVMMQEILKPLETIFAGKFFTSVSLRAFSEWGMKILKGEQEATSGANNSEDGETQLAVLVRAGMLVLEALFFSISPQDYKTRELLSSDEAVNHFAFRRYLTKTLLWYAARRPDAACASVPETIPVRVRGSVDRSNVPFWISRGFVTKRIQDEVLDAFGGLSRSQGVDRSATASRRSAAVGKRSSTAVLDDETIAREVVRRILKVETEWMNKARERARKNIFQTLTFIFDDKINAVLIDAEPEASPEEGAFKFSSVPSASVTADPSSQKEEVRKNKESWATLCEENPNMYHVAKYSVEVEVGSVQEDRDIQVMISPLLAARSFLAAFYQVDTDDELLGSSTDMIRMTYLIAVVFQTFVIERSGGTAGLSYLEEEDLERLRRLFTKLAYDSEEDKQRVLLKKKKMSDEMYRKIHIPVGTEEEDQVRGEGAPHVAEEEDDSDDEVVDMEGMM